MTSIVTRLESGSTAACTESRISSGLRSDSTLSSTALTTWFDVITSASAAAPWAGFPDGKTGVPSAFRSLLSSLNWIVDVAL